MHNFTRAAYHTDSTDYYIYSLRASVVNCNIVYSQSSEGLCCYSQYIGGITVSFCQLHTARACVVFARNGGKTRKLLVRVNKNFNMRMGIFRLTVIVFSLKWARIRINCSEYLLFLVRTIPCHCHKLSDGYPPGLCICIAMRTVRHYSRLYRRLVDLITWLVRISKLDYYFSNWLETADFSFTHWWFPHNFNFTTNRVHLVYTWSIPKDSLWAGNLEMIYWRLHGNSKLIPAIWDKTFRVFDTRHQRV